MERRTSADHTIVVRVWREMHDVTPRSRLVIVGSDDEVTARGVDDIVNSFAGILRQLLDED